ncbi:ATP-binding cassette glutathione S-conjugate transporter ycf1, partial [Coemansia sp. RSA 1939]
MALCKTRDITLDDLDELPERVRLSSIVKELNAQDGELVAVVGKTGSGKSSLLLSICGEIEKTKGTGAVFGTIAYMEQKPIIIDETVRDNILFGRKYDKEHYNRVIEACALTEDINAWKKGDRSVIGDRGMKISGGQRARLALARTIYSKADIYVLDDPLSSVDVHVKRHILDNVIMDSGLLGGKLRILTVNSEKLLPYFNQVIRLDEGKAVVTKQMTVTEHPDDTGSDSEAEPDNSFGSKSGSKPDIREWSRWSNIKYVVSICGISSLVMVTLAGFMIPVFGY